MEESRAPSPNGGRAARCVAEPAGPANRGVESAGPPAGPRIPGPWCRGGLPGLGLPRAPAAA